MERFSTRSCILRRVERLGSGARFRWRGWLLRRWLDVRLQLPVGFDVASIVMESVVIAEVNGRTLAVPIHAESSAKYGFVKHPRLADVDGDGVVETGVRFPWRDLVGALNVDANEIGVQGRLGEGTRFVAVVRVVYD